jgi:hypothetical protein
MCTLFGLDSILDGDDPVCILDSGEAMGNYQRGTSLHHPGDPLLNHLLRGAVYAGGGLVKHEYLRIKGNGPGKRYQLLLPDREVTAPLPHLFVIAVLQSLDEAVGTDRRSGLTDTLPCLLIAKADIEFDTAGEQAGILENHADPAANLCQIEFANVDPSQENASPLDFVQPCQQPGDGRLAAAAFPDDCDPFPPLDSEVETAQNVVAGLIGKRDITEFDEGTGKTPSPS